MLNLLRKKVLPLMVEMKPMVTMMIADQMVNFEPTTFETNMQFKVEIIAHDQIGILFIHPPGKVDKMRTVRQGDMMNYVKEKSQSHDSSSIDVPSNGANQ